MPLWGNRQFPGQANSKPLHGFPHYYVAANVDPAGIVRAVPPGLSGANIANNLVGVTANGMTNTSGTPLASTTLYNRFGAGGGPAHAGWITVQKGRGYIRDIAGIQVTGNNIANGTVASITGGNGVGANIIVTGVTGNGVIGNVTQLTILTSGNSFNSDIVAANGLSTAINVRVGNLVGVVSGSNAYATVFVGGRAGRTVFETIVAMGSMTGTDPVANLYFAKND